MEKPWLVHYEKEVPHSIDYPKIPLHQTLEDSARKYPDQTAIKLVLRYMGPLTMGATLTYRQLLDQVNRFASALAALGVKKGDRVALMLPNLPQFVISFYGALKLGAIVVNTNPTYTAREIEHQFSDAGAETVVLLERVLQQAERGAAAHADQARDHRGCARLCARAVPQSGQTQAA